MSKLYPSFYGTACILWIAGWTWWFSTGQYHGKDAADKPPPIFTISHDGFKYASPNIFYFLYSESVPSIPDDNQLVFQSLAHYLADHAGTKLLLTGTYALDEKNLSAFPNLGLARAEALKTVLVEKGAPKEKILTKAFSSNSFFQSNGKLMGGVYFTFSEQEAETQSPLKASNEQGTSVHEAVSKVFFYETKHYVLKKENIPFLDSLMAYLRSDGSKKVVITGFSEQAEEKATSLKLAEMRAKVVRRYLVDSGIRRNQIEVKAKPGMATGDRERIVVLSVE